MDPSTAQTALINLQKIRDEAFQALEKVKHLRNNNSKKKQAKEALKQAEENLAQEKAKATSSESRPSSPASSMLSSCPSEAAFPAIEDPEPAAGHVEDSIPTAGHVEDPTPAARHGLPMPKCTPALSSAATAQMADNIPIPGAYVLVAAQIPKISTNVPVPSAHVPLADPIPIDPALREAPGPGTNIPVSAQIADVSTVPAPGANVPLADPIPMNPTLAQAPSANVPLAGPQAKRKYFENALYTFDDDPEEEKPELSGEYLSTKKIKLTRKDKDESDGNFSDFTQAQKKKWTDAGRQAIDNFAYRDVPIPILIKTMVRKCQAYLPEAATHSAEVATAFLATSTTGGKCLYHLTNRHVKETDNPAYLTGIPGPIKKKDDPEAPVVGAPVVDDLDGSIGPVFDCGCPEEDVLFAFYLWKTCYATSTRQSCLNIIYRLTNIGDTNIAETPTPRMRSFWHQTIRDLTGVSNLCAFYAFRFIGKEKKVKKWEGNTWGSDAYNQRVRHMIIKAQQIRLQEDYGIELEIKDKDVPPPPAKPASQ